MNPKHELKAILVDCIPPGTTKEEAEHRLTEAESLIKTYGGLVVIKKIQKRQTPDYRTFIGSGKLEEIIAESKSLDANILIINNELKPHQTFNINERLRQEAEKEKKSATDPAVKGKIHKELREPLQAWDRIDVILKIFQKHATTREARLEIELASIKHMGPRIFGMGMQLSRQGGGIGTRGSGETNIEAMKRHLSKMEFRIKQELDACKKVRKVHRDGRKRLELKTVGIIGYTNAGKSTLLNSLTKKGAYAADKLFATLDTRVGKMFIENINKEVLVSDTIGFIENLPTTLIQSFQSTLEESIEADILLHVIDISDPRFLQKIEVVNEILFQIESLMKPTIYVFNKIDRLPAEQRAQFESDDMTGDNLILPNRAQLKERFGVFHPVFVSAERKEGLAELKKTLGEALFPHPSAPSATGVLDVIQQLKQTRQLRNFVQKKREQQP
ncbi:MAG: GTPase HflX [Candidatus Gracilibacteria bacterium]